MSMFDPLGDKMKMLERATAGAPIPAQHAIYVRIDGRGFSKFTRNMQRPFDPRMTRAMHTAAAHVLKATHATAAYVQSDEISLLFAPAIKEDGTPGEHFFGGKILKMTSVLAAMATAGFTRALLDDESGLSKWADQTPHFDARVVEMADPDDAIAAFAWRGQDAARNGVRQVGSAYLSHKQMDGKSNVQVAQMLAERGIYMYDMPAESMNGMLMSYTMTQRALSDVEIARIPQASRPAPGTLFSRRKLVKWVSHHPGQFANLADVLLRGAVPQIMPEREAQAPARSATMSLYPA